MIRVLFVINSLGSGGTERSTAVLLPYLRDRGIEATIVCLLHRDEGDEAAVRADGFDVRVLQSTTWRARVREMRSLIDELEPDLIHTAIFEADMLGRAAAAFTGVPVLASLVNTPYTTERYDDPRITPWKLRLVQRLDSLTGRLGNAAFHAVTQGVAEDAVASLRFASRRIAVVERGRDPEQLGRRTLERRTRAREELGRALGRPLRPDTFVVLAVGRQEFQKDHVALIRATALLERNLDDVQVVIAGREGNATSELQAAIDDHHLHDSARLLGYRTDVPELLVAADAFAMPSRYEGTAGAAIEALALESPIVATALAGTEGLLVDDVNARLVEVGDVEGLAEALEEVARNPEDAAARAERGRLTFENRFTLERSADAMAALYHSVAALRARPPALRRGLGPASAL